VIRGMVVTRDNRFLFVEAQSGDYSNNTLRSELIRYDLEEHKTHPIITHGSRLNSIRLNATEKLLVTGDLDGIVRVGPINGDEPHMLFARGPMQDAKADPGDHWVASGIGSRVIAPPVFLWRMPEGRPFTPFLAHNSWILCAL